MLGRKDYTREEIDNARAAVRRQLAAYDNIASAAGDEPTGTKVRAALEPFEALFFNNMVVVLDRYFVHRIRPVTGKDGNPLNEVELLCDSLINNNGVFRGNNVIKYVPEKSVLQTGIGDVIQLTQEDFRRLAAAFFADLESKFLAVETNA